MRDTRAEPPMLMFASVAAVVLSVLIARAARGSGLLPERELGSVSEAWLIEYRGYRRD